MGCGKSTAQAVHDPNQLRYDQDLALAMHLQAQESSVTVARRLHSARNAPVAPSTANPTLFGVDRGQGQDWGTAGGQRLGGDSGTCSGKDTLGSDALPNAASLKRKAAEAAEQRRASVPGISKDKAVELRERQQKNELLGKLTEHYARNKIDMPIGLTSASAAQLKKHWETVRGNTWSQITS
jgi:hypothetical protein